MTDLIGMTVQDTSFLFGITFKFLLVLTRVDFVVFKVNLAHSYAYVRSCHMSVLSISHQKNRKEFLEF
jgi:hypothetical protein